MKRKPLLTAMVVLVALLPVVYLAIFWKTLPPTVPTHFGADFKPDRMGSKNELWLVTAVLSIVSVGIYFLLSNLERFDPKRRGLPPSTTFNKLAFGMVVFMAALNVIIIESAKGALVIQSLLFPLLGLLLAFIGNYMNHIRPNYFAGIRLPWTLSSDENWRRTHQLAGKLWFAGGIVLAAASLVLLPPVIFPVFIGILVVIVLIPVVYSYRLFKQHV